MGIASLKDRLEHAPKSACIAADVFARLDPEQRQIVDDYITAIRDTRRIRRNLNAGDPNVTRLESELKADQIIVSYKALAAHVNGACPCGD